jgi:hypothetical protein
MVRPVQTAEGISNRCHLYCLYQIRRKMYSELTKLTSTEHSKLLNRKILRAVFCLTSKLSQVRKQKCLLRIIYETSKGRAWSLREMKPSKMGEGR